MTEAPFLLLPYAVELSSVYYNCIISINHDRGSVNHQRISEGGIRQNPGRTKSCLLVLNLLLITCQTLPAMKYTQKYSVSFEFFLASAPQTLLTHNLLIFIKEKACSFALPLHLSHTVIAACPITVLK